VFFLLIAFLLVTLRDAHPMRIPDRGPRILAAK